MDIANIARFMLFIGPISSAFDYATYFLMLWGFNAWANPSLFQTGWFVESLFSQTLIVHVIRTNQIPFIQSRASWQLTMTTIAIMGVGAWLPFSPLARYLGFVPLPWQFWPLLAMTLICYVGLTQLIKSWMVHKRWI